MLLLLYPISLLLCVVSLSLWFFYQSRKVVGQLLRLVFFLALGLYIVVVLLQGGDLVDKGPILLRDLGIMAVVPVLLSFLRKRSLAFFVILAAAAVGIGLFISRFSDSLFDSHTSQNPEQEWEWLVELAEGHSLKELNEVTKKWGLYWEPAFQMKHPDQTELDDYFVLEIPEAYEPRVDEIKTALTQTGLIDWMEENETIMVAPQPSKPVSPIQKKFGVNDPGIDLQWGFDRLQVDLLYALLKEKKVKPAQKALIAILDTGVEGQHEDLKDQYRSLNAAYDQDVRGHGTHCAGIAGAVTNNGRGIASLAPDARFVEITSIKVLSDLGSGSQQSIINGILEAADRGAAVISLSLGGRSNQSRQRAYQKAVSYAKKAGAIVIAAAGNESDQARQVAPANTPGVIAVSAVDTLLQRASFSNSVEGLEMGLAAPGVGIYSTMTNQSYATLNGTSMATPFVSGLVGLMKSIRPSLTTEEAFEILKQTGQKTAQSKETGPLVQPAAAIERLLMQ